MHQSSKLQVCASGCHLTINYKTFLFLALFSRCPTAIAQGPSKWPGPLYRSKKKFSEVPLVGTLNLCLKMPEKMQKTRNESDHPGLRKHPKKWPILILVNFFMVFGGFLSTG